MPPMCHRILKKENFKNKSADKEPILCICKKSASNQPAQLPAKYLVMSAQKYQRMKNKYNAKHENLLICCCNLYSIHEGNIQSVNSYKCI